MKAMWRKLSRKIITCTSLVRMLKINLLKPNVLLYYHFTLIVKLPIPDRKFEIKEENIPNLRKLLLKSKLNDNQE